MSSKDVKYKFPKSMGLCADRYYELRQERLAAQKVVDKIEAEEKAFKQYIIDNLPKSEASGIAGKLCRVSVSVKDIPQIENDEEFFKYIKKTGRFDLMQRRLSDASIKEIWESGKEVPGIKHFGAVTLSVNKL